MYARRVLKGNQLTVLHLFSASLLQEVGFNDEMEELQEDACDARASLSRTLYFVLGVQKGQPRHKFPRSFAMTMSDVTAHQVPEQPHDKDMEEQKPSHTLHIRAQDWWDGIIWNCVHVCQSVLGSCSQSSSTQFDSVGHWKEPHSEWWGDAHARCGRNSRGNGRGSLWLYFHDIWCTLLMFYCTSCPITSIIKRSYFVAWFDFVSISNFQ